MARRRWFWQHHCPHCGAKVGEKVWRERVSSCAACGITLYSNGPWLFGLGVLIELPLMILLYNWLDKQEGAIGWLGYLPLDLLIVLAYAVPACMLLRVRAHAAMSAAIRAAERRRSQGDAAPR